MKRFYLLLACVAVMCVAIACNPTPPAKTYGITVAPNANVTVTVQDEAEAGELVEVTATPKAGYWVSGMTVNGEVVTSTSFVMPAYDVYLNVHVKNGSEVYPVTVSDYSNGELYVVLEEAKFGEPVAVMAYALEGYRLDKLFADGIEIPTLKTEFGWQGSAVMMNEGLHFTAEFVPCEKIDGTYTELLTASSPTNPAKTYWKAHYGAEGITFEVLVKDDTYVGTGTFADGIDTSGYSVYYSDNVEFQIALATGETRADAAGVIRCLVNVDGRYKLTKANSTGASYDTSSLGIPVDYGTNFLAESVRCTDKANGFTGYAVKAYLGYDLLGLSPEEARGNLTFVPAVRDSVAYDADAKKVTTYWTSMDYKWSNVSMTRFLSDEWRGVWGDPSTFLAVKDDGSFESRFESVRTGAEYLFIGDSYFATSQWGRVKEDLCDLNAYVLGFSATKATHWLASDALDLVERLAPRNIVVHLGLNDININGTAQSTKTDVAALLNAWHNRLPETKIWWITLDPNVNHFADYATSYVQVNNAIKGMQSDWLKVIDLGERFLLSDGSINASLFNDGLHYSSFGYALYINGIRDALGMNTLSDGVEFGSARTGHATYGWEETVEEGKVVALSQVATSGGVGNDRYVYDKDFYGESFSVTASFNAIRQTNDENYPKFGIILDDGENKFLYFVASDWHLRRRNIGYVNVLATAKSVLFDWDNYHEQVQSGVFFTGDDYVTLTLEKRGDRVQMKVNGCLVMSHTLSVCKGNVSVGFFSFNTILSIKDYNLEVLA